MMFSSSIFAQSQINCELLHGRWSGEHSDAYGNYSRWTAVYSEDGRLSLRFFDAMGTEVSSQGGLWACDEGVLSTRMQSEGEQLAFSYDILSLDLIRFSYQSRHDGTVFHSDRL